MGRQPTFAVVVITRTLATLVRVVRPVPVAASRIRHSRVRLAVVSYRARPVALVTSAPTVVHDRPGGRFCTVTGPHRRPGEPTR